MSLKSLGQEGTSSSWESHSRDEDNVNDLPLLLFLISVVPALMVHPLADELNWWLSLVLLFLRHVEIINKDTELLSSWWSEHTLSSLLHSFIKGILGLVGTGLSRECHWNGLVVLSHLLVKQVANVDGLACSSWSWAKNVFSIGDQELLDVLHPDRIECWYNDVSVLGLWLNDEL